MPDKNVDLVSSGSQPIESLHKISVATSVALKVSFICYTGNDCTCIM